MLVWINGPFGTSRPKAADEVDAADTHDCDGYPTSAAWLAAMTDMTSAEISKSWALEKCRAQQPDGGEDRFDDR